MYKKQGVLITLKEPCVLSERNATEGAHRGLDYITGSSLFGAVAAALYAKEYSNSFKIFHTGDVRFKNAYPLNENREVTYPMPLCWYGKKNESPLNGLQLDASKVWRLDECENQSLPENSQPKQVRNGFVSVSGRMARTVSSLQLKSAIDPKTDRAREGSLFGYESIQKSQQFYCEIEALDEIDLEKVSEVLSRGVLLGRSKSAEYGKAKITLVDAKALEVSDNTDDGITLWCLSDVMVYDTLGQLTLTPDPTSIGLSPNYVLDRSKSHIRSRSYSPFNQYKDSYELEKQVIQKGSILIYRQINADAEENSKAITKLKTGVGVERSMGLGDVWVNPPLLRDETPEFSDAATVDTQEKQRVNSEENIPFVEWLENKAGRSYKKERQEAREDIKKYKAVCLNSYLIENKAHSEIAGPSNSQWGGLLQKVKSSDIKLDVKELFIDINSIFGDKNIGWSDKYYCEKSDSLKSINNFVIECIENRRSSKNNEFNMQRYLQFFAEEAMSLIRQGGMK